MISPMLAKEFAQNYDPDYSFEARFPDRLQELMAPGREWSMRVGKVLHGKLLGIELPINETADTMTGYIGWLQREFPDINTELIQDDSEAGLHASTEANFHRLNSSVINNWAYAIYPDVDFSNTVTRVQANKFTQYLLAVQGINHCSQRFSTSEIESDYSYLRPENKDVRTRHEALMTEYDAGALLLAVARQHSGMVAVPAPAQFEHGRRKAFNADWIVYDTKHDKAAGVQVKTHVTGKDRETYDDSIVLLDGDYDIGNVIFHRDTPGTTREKRYTWGGLICAQYIVATTLAQQAQDMRRLPRGMGLTPQALLHNRNLAHKLIGDKKIKITDSVKIVDRKVLEKLESF